MADVTDFVISGIIVHVYGAKALAESKLRTTDVLFFLHGRHGQASDCTRLVTTVLASAAAAHHGLIAITIDHRNHGHRFTSDKENLTYAEGNSTHAEDMYAIQYGTALDISFLITFLPAYLFKHDECKFAHVLCGGISLGGHSTYLAMSRDRRIDAGIVIIGCPDYLAHMQNRLAPKRVKDVLSHAAISLIESHDPTTDSFTGRKLLILKGDADTIVQWSACERFVGQLNPNDTTVIGYAGVGHACTDTMIQQTASWINAYRQAAQ